MEKRDLYDENKIKTGEWIYANEQIPLNRYIQVVTLFIVNDNNEVLIQKRSVDKGGKYGFITGHPKMNESSIEGIVTETKEEIGLQIENPKLIKSIKGRNAFFDYYIIRNNANINKLKLQKEEVEEVLWFNIKQIDELIENGLFFEKHIDVVQILNEYIF